MKKQSRPLQSDIAPGNKAQPLLAAKIRSPGASTPDDEANVVRMRLEKSSDISNLVPHEQLTDNEAREPPVH